MTIELQTFECPCGFAMQGHDEREVMELVKTHARQTHNHEVPESELRQALKSVQFTPQ